MPDFGPPAAYLKAVVDFNLWTWENMTQILDKHRHGFLNHGVWRSPFPSIKFCTGWLFGRDICTVINYWNDLLYPYWLYALHQLPFWLTDILLLLLIEQFKWFIGSPELTADFRQRHLIWEKFHSTGRCHRQYDIHTVFFSRLWSSNWL